MFPVFGKFDKRRDEFVKSKGGGGNDHNFTGFFNPVPIYHLEYDTDEGQVHQKNEPAAETVGFPLIRKTAGFLPPQDLKELDQSLGEVINAVCADPG